jgi:hypothetical protein
MYSFGLTSDSTGTGRESATGFESEQCTTTHIKPRKGFFVVLLVTQVTVDEVMVGKADSSTVHVLSCSNVPNVGIASLSLDLSIHIGVCIVIKKKKTNK